MQSFPSEDTCEYARGPPAFPRLLSSRIHATYGGTLLVSCGRASFAFQHPKKVRLHVSDQEQPDTHETTDTVEEVEDEETEQNADAQKVEQQDKPGEGEAGEQGVAPSAAPVAKAAAPPAAASAQTLTWKEDPNDFDESPVELAITFHPLKGRPQEERLLTFCIHNHSGSPVTAYYHQGELTDKAPLDRLQWAIAQEVKKFRGALSQRKQEQWEREEQAKQNRREQQARSAAKRPAAASAATPSTQQQERPASPAATATPTLAGAASPALTHSARQGSDLVQHNLF